MVDLKTAYKIVNDFFLENDYAGIYEVRETDDKWLFEGICRHTFYGASEVCVPKNGDETYIFSLTGMDNAIMWKMQRWYLYKLNNAPFLADRSRYSYIDT